ncbi:MAG TPA: alpha/beta fold hydrolase [Chitinophagaceae bacterium]|nr:alpha/beta fold hydrolase [Chitinophagaceae bacterium]
MKRHRILISGILLLSFYCGFTQTAAWKGIWQGRLQAGISLRLVFHLQQDQQGSWSALMDSPDQGVTNIPCKVEWITDDSLALNIPSIKGSLNVRKINDSSLQGTWQQGVRLPLLLQRAAIAWQASRPQTPQPPFPYRSDSVIIKSAATGLRYGASICYPAGKGPHPALLLISGSGPQNRDEELLGHKPFAVLADYLCRRGYIVLRADDRGTGQSSGDFSLANTADFCSDAEAQLDWLRKQPEVDTARVGVLGHSEGGLIAAILASQDKGVSFIILMAAPGIAIDSLMAEQNKALLLSSGIADPAAASYAAFYKRTVSACATAPNRDSAYQLLVRQFQHWKERVPKAYSISTTGVYDGQSLNRWASAMVNQLYTPWFRYFIQLDPASYLQKISCSVLAINGSRDLQVPAISNLQGIRKALEKSAAKNYELKELEGLNHLFQECHSCRINEYGSLEESISPKALELISDWLARNMTE